MPRPDEEIVEATTDGGQQQFRDREPPPKYDGVNPEKTYKVWKKDLRLWIGSTDIPENKRGAKVMKAVSGVAKDALEDLDIEEILKPGGVEVIVNILDKAFAPYLEQTMPRAFERAVYNGHREKSQSLLTYTVAAQARFNELRREGVDLPGPTRG